MYYHLTVKSTNRKTGKIPVSTSSQKTCPDSCQLKKVCYADVGCLKWHWDKVSNGTQKNLSNWEGFVEKIGALPKDQLWRHNQAGDLVGKKDVICAYSLDDLIEANKGKRGFTYTHYPIIKEQYKGNESNEANGIVGFNKLCVQRANDGGFTVNVSADNLEIAEKLFNEGLPTVSVVSEDAPAKGKTKNGIPYIVCPAQVKEGVTCHSCGLCQKSQRKAIIAFQVHGTHKGQYVG